MDVSSSSPTQSGAIRDQRIQPVDQTQRKAHKGVSVRRAPDEAIISEQAQLLLKLSEAVQNSKDVRDEKVNALRDQVENGRYPTSASEIARAIVASRMK